MEKLDLEQYRNINKMLDDLNVAAKICSQRGLTDTGIWCADMLKDLKCISGQDDQSSTTNQSASNGSLASQVNLISTSSLQIADELPNFERTLYDLALPLFQKQQYRRVQEVVASTSSPLCRFLKYYATYFQTDYLRLSTNLQPIGGSGSDVTEDYADAMRQLLLEIEETMKTCTASSNDGFIHYLHAIVSARIGCDKEFVQKSALRAVTLCPGIWAFWQFLSTFVPTIDDLDGLELPKHWYLPMFKAEALYNMAEYGQALDLYDQMGNYPLGHTNYIQLRLALTLKNLQQTGRALAVSVFLTSFVGLHFCISRL